MGRVIIPGFRKIETSGGGEGGTTNYNDLTNKPSINNVPLVGNIRTVDLELTDPTLTEEGVPAEAKTVGTKLEEHSTSLTALSEQLGSHTVKSNVPENAVFTDTIYDDTEVKESIDELNSNLDGLGYGENTGSGNLFREEYKNDSLYVKKSKYQSYLKTNIKGITKLYATVKLKGTSQSNYSCSIGNTDILADKRFLNYGNISIQEYDFGVDDYVYIQIGCNSGVDVNTFFENYEIIISDSTITSDTPYEPYIPSVKMLAEEVNAQNESLSDYGFVDVFDGQFIYDAYYSSDDGTLKTNSAGSNIDKCSKNKMSCVVGKPVTVKASQIVSIIGIRFYKADGTYISGSNGINVKSYTVTAPTNASYYHFMVESSSGVNVLNIKCTSYMDNVIDELKNDLIFKNVWSGEIYKANETATISNFSNSKKYLFEFNAKSNAYKQNVIVLGNQVYIEVPLVGHASTLAFTLYRLNISSNGVVTISDVINEDSGASLVNIYEI